AGGPGNDVTAAFQCGNGRVIVEAGRGIDLRLATELLAVGAETLHEYIQIDSTLLDVGIAPRVLVPVIIMRFAGPSDDITAICQSHNFRVTLVSIGFGIDLDRLAVFGTVGV